MKHYPALPHSPFEKLFDNIWWVKGTAKMPMFIPMKFSRSMTVIKDGASGELTIVNSMRLTDQGHAELDKIGKVSHVIRLAGFHGRDDGFYRERYGAKIHALKGQHYSRKLDNKVPERNYMEPDEWLTADGPLPVAEAELKVFTSATPAEGALLLKRDGGILITGDTLQHTPAPDEYVNFPARVMMKRMGFFKAHNIGPGWLQSAKPTASDVRSILDLEFDHVLPGHGDPVIGGAKQKFRPAVEGPLKGCHEH